MFTLAAFLLVADPESLPAGCMADFATLEAALAAQYSEAPVMRATTQRGEMLVVFMSAQGKTYSISITAPDGLTCVKSIGADWQSKLVGRPL